ncbi:MAG TPA: hypothetical protein VNZ06_07595 [Steroidobacteraceae bacterium]|nr:hypothetical protein [Steroidobacteraceae bacterium]
MRRFLAQSARLSRYQYISRETEAARYIARTTQGAFLWYLLAPRQWREQMSQGSHSHGKTEKVVDLFSSDDPYNRRPIHVTDTARRRTLDDMRRLSEEIKSERAASGRNQVDSRS